MFWFNRNQKNKQTDDSVYLQHTKKYTNLLDVFVKNTNASNRLKIFLKFLFFLIIILIMIALGALFAYSILSTFEIIKKLENTSNNLTESIIGAAVSIIPSFVTMIVSLIKLPEIIAEYLFNPDEDKDMVKIIEQIQNYDLQMYSLEQEVKSLRMKQQERDQQSFDRILGSYINGKIKTPKDATNELENSNNVSGSKN